MKRQMRIVPALGPRRTGRGPLLLALVVLLLMLWVSGLLGKSLTYWAAEIMLPVRLGGFLEIESVDYAPPPQAPRFGALLVISADRAEEILCAAEPRARWLPPGLLHDGLVLRGRVLGPAVGLDPGDDVSCTVAIADAQGYRPHLRLRSPAAVLNDALRGDLQEALVTKDDGLLGKYRITYKPFFKRFIMRSTEAHVSAPVTRRHFTFSGRGTVRVIYDGGPRITVDGSVKRFNGIVLARVMRDENGLSFWYDLDAKRFEVNFDDMHSWIDSELSDALERAIEKGLDKRRLKTKLSKLRVPHWIPVDMSISFLLED